MLSPQPFTSHHFTTHINISHKVSFYPLPYTARHFTSFHFTTLLDYFHFILSICVHLNVHNVAIYILRSVSNNTWNKRQTWCWIWTHVSQNKVGYSTKWSGFTLVIRAICYYSMMGCDVCLPYQPPFRRTVSHAFDLRFHLLPIRVSHKPSALMHILRESIDLT